MRLGRRAGPGLVALAMLAGCSSLDPTGLLGESDDPVVPETVASEDSGERADFPKLFEGDAGPARTPSEQSERDSARKSLAADRENARYADEPLQAEGVGADAGKRQVAAAESQAEAQEAEARREATEGAAEAAQREAEAQEAEARRQAEAQREAEAQAAEARQQAETAEEAGPAVPPAPSDVADAADAAGAASSGTDATADGATQRQTTQSQSTQSQSTQRESTQTAARARDAEAADTTETARTAAGQTTAGQTAGASPAVEIDRSQIPQIQPSREGEPIRVPGRARRGGASSANGIQSARRQQTGSRALRSPPRQAGDLRPGAQVADASGERIAVIYFGHGAAALNGQDRKVLRQVARIHESRGGAVHIVGHASQRTATMDMLQHRMANLDVSMKRAETVADLLASFGVPRGAIQVEARADRDLLYHEFMPTGEAGNRRAEIYLRRQG